MSGNPMLSESAFQKAGSVAVLDRGASPADEWARAQGTAGAQTLQPPPPPDSTLPRPSGPPPAPPGATLSGRAMSLGGVASATGLMFAVLLVGGWWGWGQVDPGTKVGDVMTVEPSFKSPGLFFGALIIAFAFAIATAFMPKAARFTSLPYALCEGAVLGMISRFYEVQFDGIVVQAILATAGVFLVMLVLYGLRILRATPRFVKGVIAATLGIVLLYFVGFLFSLFGSGFSFWNDSSVLGIGISVVICIVAALNLIIDFDFIEKGVAAKAPAYMDWYAGFSLVVTLVWLYLEMLRLLSKLRQ
jgi:uncharacterized YccA/Bax inhibitor family protein